jgi:hypothetical protein
MSVRIEGYTPDKLLALPQSELDPLIFAGRPLVVRVGTADILLECRHQGTRLTLDLAHIDGGGEGALPTLGAFADRFARSRGFSTIEWAVRATNCARPNERLRRVLVRRGFIVQDVPGLGECYYLTTEVLGQRQGPVE